MPTPTYRTDTTDAGDYKSIDQENSFEFDAGLAVCPVSTRTAAHKIIRLHGGIGLRRTTWHASRQGRPPIIPAYGNAGNDTILTSVVTPTLPTPNVTMGGYDWSVSGQNTYVQGLPRLAGYTTFPVGDYPFPVLPNLNMAGITATPYLDQYQGADPFANLIEAIAADTEYIGSYTWPFLALPSVFSSTHLIGG